MKGAYNVINLTGQFVPTSVSLVFVSFIRNYVPR